MSYRHLVAVMATAAVTSTLTLSAAVPCVAQANRTITLESGTVIPVRLRDTISSLDSRKGERFSATLQSEEAARSLRLPIGTIIEGTVASVRAREGKDPGVVALKFDRVILPNESTYPIQGSLIGLDNKSVTRESNGRLVAKPDQKNKTLLYAGYGAGAGLILGAITKGNTILDTLIGGGLGYLLGNLDKNHGEPRDVLLKPNTELGVRLDRSLTVKEYYDNRDTSDPNLDPDRRNRTDRDGNPIKLDRNGDPIRYDRNGDPIRLDRNGDPARYDRNGDPITTDRNGNPIVRTDRDPSDYRVTDGSTRGNGDTRKSGDYRILNQYTDIRNNGEPIRVFLNGRSVSFNSGRPFIAAGTVMVPVVPVLRADTVRYSATDDQFIAYGPDETFTGSVDSRFVTGPGDRRLTLPAAIQRRNGTLFVPMQYLALITGRKLTFDRDTQTIELGTPRPDSARP